MFGCAHHRLVLRPMDDGCDEKFEEPESAAGVLVEIPRKIDRETMVMLGLPASMIERLLAPESR